MIQLLVLKNYKMFELAGKFRFKNYDKVLKFKDLGKERNYLELFWILNLEIFRKCGQCAWYFKIQKHEKLDHYQFLNATIPTNYGTYWKYGKRASYFKIQKYTKNVLVSSFYMLLTITELQSRLNKLGRF